MPTRSDGGNPTGDDVSKRPPGGSTKRPPTVDDKMPTRNPYTDPTLSVTHRKPQNDSLVLPPYCNKYSTFFNDDGPLSGSPPYDDGDYELISDIKLRHNFCNIPGSYIKSADCQTVHNGYHYTSAAQVNVICNNVTGLRCKNSDQLNPLLPISDPCEDYMISLFCVCPPLNDEYYSTTTPEPSKRPSTITRVREDTTTPAPTKGWSLLLYNT